MKRIHAAQWRATGPTAGMRMLRQITGRQRWLLRAWIQYAPEHAPIDVIEGKPRRRERDEHEIPVDVPCMPADLVPHYEKAIHELCAGAPVVLDAGFDAYVLPRNRYPKLSRLHHLRNP